MRISDWSSDVCSSDLERFYDPRVYVDQITDILTDRRVESSKVAQAEKVESAPSAGADRTLVASAGSTTSEAPIPALEIVPVEAELLGDGDYIPLTPVPSERDAAPSTGLTDAGVSGPRSRWERRRVGKRGVSKGKVR